MLFIRVFSSLLILSFLTLKAASFEHQDHPAWNFATLDHEDASNLRSCSLGLKKPNPDVEREARNKLRFVHDSVSATLTHTVGRVSLSTTLIVELANIRSYPSSLIYDQLNIGSCTANSGGFNIRYLTARNSTTPTIFDSRNPQVLVPSRLYHYYNTRYFEGVIMRYPKNVLEDNGASMLGAMLAMDRFGCSPEALSVTLDHGFTYSGWAYDTAQFATNPPPEAHRFGYDPSMNGLYTDTRPNPYRVISTNIRYTDLTSKYHKTSWTALNSATEIASAIADFRTALSKNQPIYIGIPVEQAFLNAPGGYIPMPALSSSFRPIGGHAISIVGHGPYKSGSTQNYFKFINSWSATWGDHGYGYLPEAYVANINYFGIDAFAVDLLK